MATLRTQGDIITDFLVKMNTSTTAGFYTDRILTTWASNAHAWAVSRHKWPFSEGRYSTTSASLGTNEDGYTTLEYPEGFQPDSVRLLTIGGKKFDKKNFFKFRDFLEDNPSDTSNIFSDYARRMYINPHASGISGTVVVWGQINIAPLATDTITGGDTGPDPSALTIFSDFANEANEAIVEKMMSYALDREKSPTSIVGGKSVNAGSSHEFKAGAILDAVWKRITDEQFSYQDTRNDGMFKRFDVLGGGFKEDIFNRDQFGW